MAKVYDCWGFSDQPSMFRWIAESRELKSFLTNKTLPSIHSRFFLNVFAHVLSKSQGKYHKFKLNPNNIVLLTPEEHYLYDMGTKEQREKYAKENKCDWDRLFDLAKKLKQDYAVFEAKNL
jgi:hypothetical protein